MGVPEKNISSVGNRGRHTAPDVSRVLAVQAAEAMLDKKVYDVTIMDMREVSGFADYFVLGTGDSDRQIKAVMENVEERLRERCGEKPWHVEGADVWGWVLLDYVDVVVHVFSPAKRGFYDLERLWGDAPRERISDDSASAEIRALASSWGEAFSGERRVGGAL